MKIITSWDDGHELDVRVMELLRKYELPGIFFVPIESWGYKNLEKYEGFEIGGHTWSHPTDMKKLNDGVLLIEIEMAKRSLQEKLAVCRKEIGIPWFCYPRGRYDERVIESVKDAGFKRARTMTIGFADIHFEMQGFHCFQRKEYGAEDWLDYIRRQVRKFHDDPFGQLHIWGHSWEIDKNNEWGKLEELFKYASRYC